MEASDSEGGDLLMLSHQIFIFNILRPHVQHADLQYFQTSFSLNISGASPLFQCQASMFLICNIHIDS